MKPELYQPANAILLACAILLITLTGCHGTEQTYRQAYEVAKAKQVEAAGGTTIYDAIRNEAVITTAEVSGRSVNLKREFVLVTKELDAQPSWLKVYNVVVGGFKQLVHARSLAERFRAGGYESAYIVQTREPYYYVVAVGSDSLDPLLPILDSISQSSPVRLAPSYPWVLRPANR